MTDLRKLVRAVRDVEKAAKAIDLDALDQAAADTLWDIVFRLRELVDQVGDMAVMADTDAGPEEESG